MDRIDTDDTLNRRNTIVTFPELNMVTPMFLPRVAGIRKIWPRNHERSPY